MLRALTVAGLMCAALPAHAQQTVKIGMINVLSGQFADAGIQMENGARTYMNAQGLASDPAPWKLWMWTATFGASIALAAMGFRSARWWRRGLSLAAIPQTLLCALLVLNSWVGY